jgi:hypothetical protein
MMTQKGELIIASAFPLTEHLYLKNPINALPRMYSFILHNTPERYDKDY